MLAYVWYLSAGQLNVQAPEDPVTGNFAITVTNCKATSPMFVLARRALTPGFLAPSNYTANGTPYMVATFASDGAYVLNTATGTSFGLNSRPAKPGDVIVAYGIGFGDVAPSILPGVIVGQSNALMAPVTISFGTTKATYLMRVWPGASSVCTSSTSRSAARGRGLSDQCDTERDGGAADHVSDRA